MEDESNINDRVLPMPMEPPPSLVAQEESRPHQKVAQIVFSTPHRPRQRMEGGEKLCVVLRPHTLTSQHTAIVPLHTNCTKGRVLENVLPLPVQATTHLGGHCSELVCPPLPRHEGDKLWLQQTDIVCGSVLTSPLSYEEGSEVGCSGVGWGRMTQTPPHQTSNTTMPSSMVWNNLGAIGTLQNTTHHYIH